MVSVSSDGMTRQGVRVDAWWNEPRSLPVRGCIGCGADGRQADMVIGRTISVSVRPFPVRERRMRIHRE